MFAFGPAAAGAPNGVLGAGLALATLHGVRVEANAQLGWSSSSTSIDANPAWNDGFTTYSAAEWTSRTALLELAASRRKGPLELWAGAGVHVSWIQLEATYEATRCTDLLCLGQTYRVTDEDEAAGSGAVGLALSAGARVPLSDHLLVGLDLRWLAPATSRVGDPFGVDARLGGVSVAAGFTLRLGAPVRR